MPCAFPVRRTALSLAGALAFLAGIGAIGTPAQAQLLRLDLNRVAGHSPATLPADDQRQGLLAALDGLRGIARAGGFVRVPDGTVLRPGDRSPAIPLLAERLRQSGDLLGQPEIDPTLYGGAVELAVRRFQARHGLEVDGIVGANSFTALNESVESLIDRLRVNLARLDAMPRPGAGRHLVVNLPAYELTAYRDGQPVFTMDVVVGRASRPTPELSSPITHLVVNPTWTVPRNILRRDVAPSVLGDPDYIANRNMRVLAVDGEETAQSVPESIDWEAVRSGQTHVTVRQAPGPANPLGRYRFHMHNNQSIYLHDTNERHLLYRSQRAYSSGCVRVEDATRLAAFVAEGVSEPWQSWAEDPAWQTRWVRLPAPVEVDLIYRTAWVDAAGVLQVRADLYGRDRHDRLSLPPDNGTGS